MQDCGSDDLQVIRHGCHDRSSFQGVQDVGHVCSFAWLPAVSLNCEMDCFIY